MIPRRIFTQWEEAHRKGCLLEGPDIGHPLHPAIQGGSGDVRVRDAAHEAFMINVGVRPGGTHTGLEQSKTMAEEVQCYSM